MKIVEKFSLALTALSQCQAWFESMKTTFEVDLSTEHGDKFDIPLSNILDVLNEEEDIDFSDGGESMELRLALRENEVKLLAHACKLAGEKITFVLQGLKQGGEANTVVLNQALSVLDDAQRSIESDIDFSAMNP